MVELQDLHCSATHGSSSRAFPHGIHHVRTVAAVCAYRHGGRALSSTHRARTRVGHVGGLHGKPTGMNAEVPTSTAFLLGWRCCVPRRKRRPWVALADAHVIERIDSRISRGRTHTRRSLGCMAWWRTGIQFCMVLTGMGPRSSSRRLGCATSRSYPTQRGRPRLPDTDILCSDAYDLSC